MLILILMSGLVRFV